MIITLEQIKNKIKKIQSKGEIPIPNDLNYDDSNFLGNFFESLLGIKINNLPTPDYKGWELKTVTNDSDSLLSLFTLSPNDGISVDKLRKTYGYIPFGDKFKKLNINVEFDKWSNTKREYSFKLKIEDNNLILMIKNNKYNKILKSQLKWKINDIIQETKLKLKNLCYINGVIDSSNKTVIFKDCELYLGLVEDKIKQQLEEGNIKFSIRLSHKKGFDITKDRGFAFRIEKENINSLYEQKINVFAPKLEDIENQKNKKIR